MGIETISNNIHTNNVNKTKADATQPHTPENYDVENCNPRNIDPHVSKNKDGDTLEISDEAVHKLKEGDRVVVVSNNSIKYTDAILSKMSGNKLKTLLANGQITKAQYAKAMQKNH